MAVAFTMGDVSGDFDGDADGSFDEGKIAPGVGLVDVGIAMGRGADGVTDGLRDGDVDGDDGDDDDVSTIVLGGVDGDTGDVGVIVGEAIAAIGASPDVGMVGPEVEEGAKSNLNPKFTALASPSSNSKHSVRPVSGSAALSTSG